MILSRLKEPEFAAVRAIGVHSFVPIGNQTIEVGLRPWEIGSCHKGVQISVFILKSNRQSFPVHPNTMCHDVV